MNESASVWRGICIALIVYSVATTVALFWTRGRGSRVDQAPTIVSSKPAVVPSSAHPATAPRPAAKPIVQYPQFQSTIPRGFRGAWDEIVSDKCFGREARFYFGDRQFMNFEVEWEVTKVKLYSPTEIDLYTTTYGENKSQVDEVWQFKLVDDGSTLTGRKQGSSFFKRCPKS